MDDQIGKEGNFLFIEVFQLINEGGMIEFHHLQSLRN